MFKRLFSVLGLVALLGSIFWSANIQQIAAGVAVFLFGMLSMDEGFKAFTGGTLERLLAISTNRIWKSLSFGILSTTLVQSSSLISVITISFLSSGLLDLVQGIGIIFGANIGTTTGAWLVSAFGLKVKISAYAMPMLIVGIVFIMQSSKTIKGIGHILSGLGFLFLGIHFMKEGFEAFRSVIDLQAFALEGVLGLIIFVLLGLLATVVMQSSHATLVLIITALSTGQVSYENAIALAIGANIGTTITAIIGAMGANTAGKQLAAAHLIFNGVTASVALALLNPLIFSVDILSGWFGFSPEDYTLKLALFHTLFNTLGVCIMLPFIRPLAALLQRWMMDDRRQQLNIPVHREDYRTTEIKPGYVSNIVFSHPDTALSAIVQETSRMWSNAIGVMSYALFLNRDDVDSELPKDLIVGRSDIRAVTTDVDELYVRYIRPLNTAILEAVSKVPKPVSPQQNESLFALKLACRDLVNAIKDVKHLQKNLVRYQDSKNKALRMLYQDFRIQLATLMQQLENIVNYPDEEDALLAFTLQHRRLLENDIVRNGRLDQDIANDLIPVETISSLTNDSQYCLDIGRRLLQMAQTLYWAKSGNEQSLLKDLILSHEELSEGRHE
ncbi:MAG: Na/Pi symporter [Reinekea sp.]